MFPISRFVIAVILVLALSGCEQIAAWNKTEKEQSLLMAGSSTMVHLAEKLTQAFTQGNQGISIVCEGGGSTAGIVALQRGVIDLALLSRDVHGREDAPGLRCLPYARNAVGLVAHPSNSLSDLSVEQIRHILLGDITDWAAVGGKTGPVRVISRNAGSTTLQIVNDLVVHGEDLAHDAVHAASARELLEKVAADPQAVGFVSYADLEHLANSSRNTVALLTVQGVPMQRETILSGRYPLTRVLYFAVRDVTPAAQAFLNFALGPEGRKVTQEQGLLLVR
jgi:phosphate transport system substrate-binding protein